MTEPSNFDDLPASELKRLVVQLLAENAEQRRQIAALREEVSRLKGSKGPPNIKPPSRPSGMERGTSPQGRRGKGRGKFVPRIGIEERTIAAEAPAGSRFKGYESFLVQDLVLRARAIRYRRERWVTPESRDVLRAGYTDYVVNEAALAYMRGRALAGPVIRTLGDATAKEFADHAAWQAHLERLGISALKVHPDPRSGSPPKVRSGVPSGPMGS